MRRITVFDPKRNFCAVTCCFDIATNYVARTSRILPSCVGLHMNEKQVSEKTTLVKRGNKNRVFHPNRNSIVPKTALHSVDDAECAAPNPRIALSRSYANSVSWSAAWLFRQARCASALLALLLCDSALSGSLRKLPSKTRALRQQHRHAHRCLLSVFFVSVPRSVCRSPNEIHHIRVAHWPPHAKTHVRRNQQQAWSPHGCLKPRACRWRSKQFLSSRARSPFCNATTARHLGLHRR